MGEDRCRHEMLPGQCSDCASGGFPARVYVTDGGTAFHRVAGCPALEEGQRIARRFGQRTHPPRQVALAVAQQQLRGECAVCFGS